MKVITLAPNIPAPYNTMGAIYEHQGKKDKALDCYMIAAHLNKLVRHGTQYRPKYYATSTWHRLFVMHIHVYYV